MGKGYAIDNCIAFIKRHQKEKIYQIYVTDALQAITSNIAHINGGVEFRKRYIELIEPKKEETRTPEEIISQIKKKLGG